MTRDDRLFEEHEERPRRSPDAARTTADREVPLHMSEEPMPDALDAWLGVPLAQRRRTGAPAGFAARVMDAIAHLPS